MAVSSYWVAAIPVFFRRPNTPVISWFTINGAPDEGRSSTSAWPR